MDITHLLLEIHGRIPPLVRAAVEDLDAEQLVWRPGREANSIGWLVWHLTRVQDHHMAELVADDQIWVTGEWAESFSLTPDPSNTGYGHAADEVASVRPVSPEALVDYHDAVNARTVAMLAKLAPADLDRIVDRRWDPPVTMGVRLVSIADDCLQHAGQALYVRGLLQN